MASKKLNIETELTAKIDDLTAKLNRANNQISGFKNKSQNSIGSLIGGLGKVAGAIGVAFAVKDAVGFGLELNKLRVKVRGVENAFNTLNSPQLLNQLRKATNGLVTDLQLMQTAIKAKNFKIPLEELSTYLQFATQRAAETGESVEYLVDSIITGLGRQSTQILDNLGISSTELKNEMQKTGNMASALGNIIRRDMKNSLDDTKITTDNLAVSWDNLKVTLSKNDIFGGIFNDILTNFDYILVKTNDFFKEFNKGPGETPEWVEYLKIAGEYSGKLITFAGTFAKDVLSLGLYSILGKSTDEQKAYLKNKEVIDELNSTLLASSKLYDNLYINRGRLNDQSEDLIKNIRSEIKEYNNLSISDKLLKSDEIKNLYNNLIVYNEQLKESSDNIVGLYSRNSSTMRQKINEIEASTKGEKIIEYFEKIKNITNDFNQTLSKKGGLVNLDKSEIDSVVSEYERLINESEELFNSIDKNNLSTSYLNDLIKIKENINNLNKAFLEFKESITKGYILGTINKDIEDITTEVINTDAAFNKLSESIKKIGDNLKELSLSEKGYYDQYIKNIQYLGDQREGEGRLKYTEEVVEKMIGQINQAYRAQTLNITQLEYALSVIESGMKYANESQYQYLNKFKREIEEILDIFGKSREKLPVYDKLESKGIESINLKSNDNINTTLKDPNRLKTLIELEKELNDLELERSKSPTPEYYANLTNLIKIKEEEIANFKGEMIGTAYTMVDVFSSSASSFNSMGQAMRSFGNDGAGGIMDMIAAMLQLMVTFEQLASIIQVTSAIKVATNTAEVASNQALIASNSGVAITEATKSGSKMPFPFNIIAIAAGVAAVIAALANISKFETGGIVGGTSFSGDNVLARVNSGEMILNKTQQSKLFNMINDGRVGAGGGNVTFEIKGDRLVGVLNNLNRKTKAYV